MFSYRSKIWSNVYKAQSNCFEISKSKSRFNSLWLKKSFILSPATICTVAPSMNDRWMNEWLCEYKLIYFHNITKNSSLLGFMQKKITNHGNIVHKYLLSFITKIPEADMNITNSPGHYYIFLLINIIYSEYLPSCTIYTYVVAF